MKFTDGQWILQPGVTANCASQAYEIFTFADRMEALSAARPICHRGDTLLVAPALSGHGSFYLAKRTDGAWTDLPGACAAKAMPEPAPSTRTH